MNRKEFFKKLGFGALAVAIAPRVVAKEETTEKSQNEQMFEWTKNTFKPLYKRKDVEKGFEISNQRFIGIVYYDKDGNSHIVYS